MSLNDNNFSSYSNAKNMNMSLKRDKNAFHMSTTAFSSANTIERNNFKSQDISLNQTLSVQKNRQSLSNQNALIKRYSSDVSFPKISDTESFKNLQKLIIQQKDLNLSSAHLLKQSTHVYFSKVSIIKNNYNKNRNQIQQNQRYYRTQQQNFVPKIVQETFKRYNNENKEVNYNYGYLQKTGYMYFSIQNTLILTYFEQFNNPSENYEPIIIQMSEHVISIKQIIVSDLNIQQIQKHPFGQKNVILLMWQPWKICFYSFQPQFLVKVQDLNLKYETSCQVAKMFQYCKYGNVYYLSQAGQLGRIKLFHKQLNIKNFINWNWSKKYCIRQNFFKFTHNTSRKYEKNPHQSILKKIKQTYKYIQYYWSKKKTRPICLVCDKQKMLLYTLVQTSLLQSKNLNRVSNQSNRQMRVYDINPIKKNKNYQFFQRIQAEIYDDPPILLTSLNEQKLYNQVCSHLFNNLSLMKFQIVGLFIPRNYLPSISHVANIIMLLSNGSRLYFHFKHYNLVLSQMINLPNLDDLFKKSISNSQNNQNFIFTQRQPTNFKVLQYAYNPEDNSLGILGLQKRNTIGLIFTQCEYLSLNRQNTNKQQVQIVFDQPIQQDLNIQSIFVNSLDFMICITPQLQKNIYKNKIFQLKQKLIQKKQNQSKSFVNKDLQRRSKNLTNTKSFMSQKPQSRQVLHYPRKFLFINIKKNIISGIAKLRPVDILLNTLQKQINQYSNITNTSKQSILSSIILNDYQTVNINKKLQNSISASISGKIVNKQQFIALLTQIYCDIDGVYFCQEYSISHKKSSSKLRQKTQRQKNFASYKQSYFGGRMTQDVMFNYNNNRQNKFQGSSLLSNKQKKVRFSQKLYKNQIFKKYRYSDLVSQNSTIQSMRYSTSPIKYKSQKSLIKVIEKLVILRLKQNNQNIRNFYKQKFKQNQWLDSSTTAPSFHTLSKQIQEGILIYLARLINPIWYSQIKLIKGQAYIFITQILKQIFQLLIKIQKQQMEMNFNQKLQDSSFSSIFQLIGSLIEYNLMLGVIQIQLNLKYGQAFGSQKQAFEEAIFQSIQKKKQKQNISSTVNEWRDLFPSYFNIHLFRAIKLQAEINLILSPREKKQIIIKNSNLMPHYLLYSYFKDGTLTKKEMKTLLENVEASKSYSNLRNVSHLIITDSMSPQQKIQYAINEIQKNTHNLQDKQFLLNYALQNLDCVRILQSLQIHRKKLQLLNLSKIIKVQQLILKQLKQITKQNTKIHISQSTKKLVQYYLLSPSQLKGLVKQLQSPVVQLICYCTFSDKDEDINRILREITFDQKGNKINSKQIKQKLVKIFQIFTKENISKLPLNSLLIILDQIAIKDIKYQNLAVVLYKNNQQKVKKYFWVPLFLSQWGWNQVKILDHYIELSKQFNHNISIQSQKIFLYNWISAYAFVKWRYKDGRRVFQISNEVTLKLNSNHGINANQNIKILIDFIRENLAY